MIIRSASAPLTLKIELMHLKRGNHALKRMMYKIADRAQQQTKLLVDKETSFVVEKLNECCLLLRKVVSPADGRFSLQIHSDLQAFSLLQARLILSRLDKLTNNRA